jgi:hypothetical protein
MTPLGVEGGDHEIWKDTLLGDATMTFEGALGAASSVRARAIGDAAWPTEFSTTITNEYHVKGWRPPKVAVRLLKRESAVVSVRDGVPNADIVP